MGARRGRPILTHHHMKKYILSILCAAISIAGCTTKNRDMEKGKETASTCSASCEAQNESVEMSCKLTTPELRKRKETVLASLKNQVLEKKELPEGYAYKFTGTDGMIDELTEFIKTERACCDFFIFNISISGDQNEAWLEIKGRKGTKDFIESELGL